MYEWGLVVVSIASSVDQGSLLCRVSHVVVHDVWFSWTMVKQPLLSAYLLNKLFLVVVYILCYPWICIVYFNANVVMAREWSEIVKSHTSEKQISTCSCKLSNELEKDRRLIEWFVNFRRCVKVSCILSKPLIITADILRTDTAGASISIGTGDGPALKNQRGRS